MSLSLPALLVRKRPPPGFLWPTQPGRFRAFSSCDAAFRPRRNSSSGTDNSSSYRNSYNYTQASVTLTYDENNETFHGLLNATNLKPNFAYQVKLSGISGTPSNEQIGLAGRWWQEEWNGDGGTYSGNWAAAMGNNVSFNISDENIDDANPWCFSS